MAAGDPEGLRERLPVLVGRPWSRSVRLEEVLARYIKLDRCTMLSFEGDLLRNGWGEHKMMIEGGPLI